MIIYQSDERVLSARSGLLTYEDPDYSIRVTLTSTTATASATASASVNIPWLEYRKGMILWKLTSTCGIVVKLLPSNRYSVIHYTLGYSNHSRRIILNLRSYHYDYVATIKINSDGRFEITVDYYDPINGFRLLTVEPLSWLERMSSSRPLNYRIYSPLQYVFTIPFDLPGIVLLICRWITDW